MRWEKALTKKTFDRPYRRIGVFFLLFPFLHFPPVAFHLTVLAIHSNVLPEKNPMDRGATGRLQSMGVQRVRPTEHPHKPTAAVFYVVEDKPEGIQMLRQPRNSELSQDLWWGGRVGQRNCVLSQEPLGGRDA